MDRPPQKAKPRAKRHSNASTRPVLPLIGYATRSGGTTLDQDECGGNPFATALIRLAGESDLTLRNLPSRLRVLTGSLSDGHQVPEFTQSPASRNWQWRLALGSRREKRQALVLVVADYGPMTGSLSGAAYDERRIAVMLAESGFSVRQGVSGTRAAILRALRDFQRLTRRADVAVVYSTGHGIEQAGQVFLLPGNFPFSLGVGARQLSKHAVSVVDIARSTQAGKVNLVLFAGCRSLDNEVP